MLPAPPPPDVPVSELRIRLNAVRREMERDGIDILILTDQKNIEYFTDYRTLTWEYNARPLFCLIDQRDFVMIASRIETRNLASKECAFSVVLYDGYLAEAVHTLVAAIAVRDALSKATVAIDYGQDMFGRGCLELFHALAARASRKPVESGAPAIWRVRMFKSPFEARLKQTAFEIVNSAFDEAIARARLGVTELDLCRDVQARTIAKGADHAAPITMLFGRGDFVFNRPAGTRMLKPGEYLWTDFRAPYGGYPADRNRIARAGKPETWEVEIYSKTRAVTTQLAQSVRAGMTCGDVFSAFERVWCDAALPPVYGLVSRIGHGGGLDVTEPPSIAKHSPELIKPGMILHLEPKIEVGGAVFQFEEVIHVREDDVVFLSALAPEEIPVVG